MEDLSLKHMNESIKPIGHWKKILLAITAVVFVALGLAFHVDNSLPGAARVFVEFLAFTGLLFAWLLSAAIIVKGFRWLISRQAWIIYLKIGVGILSLIVLFYSVEKWRGKRAWTRLQQEVEGRGEKLDLSDVIGRDVGKPVQAAHDRLLDVALGALRPRRRRERQGEPESRSHHRLHIVTPFVMQFSNQ